jgi:hypothetical protein
MLRLTSRASELFLQQPAFEQRRLLQVIVEKAAWHHGELQTTLFEPFEVLRRSNHESYRNEKEIGGSATDLKEWLPKMAGFERILQPQVIDLKRPTLSPPNFLHHSSGQRAQGPKRDQEGAWLVAKFHIRESRMRNEVAGIPGQERTQTTLVPDF